MIMWRMPAKPAFKRANDQMLGAVERQGNNGCASHGSDADDLMAGPSKMKIPLLHTRMKDAHRTASPGICRQLPCSFSQGAMDAGQCKIADQSLASCDSWHYMIDMKCRGLAEMR
jgi:hypothetical protein